MPVCGGGVGRAERRGRVVAARQGVEDDVYEAALHQFQEDVRYAGLRVVRASSSPCAARRPGCDPVRNDGHQRDVRCARSLLGYLCVLVRSARGMAGTL